MSRHRHVRNLQQDYLDDYYEDPDYDEEEDLEYDSDETTKDNVLLFPTIH